MDTLVFDKRLNDFCRKYLDTNYRPVPTPVDLLREHDAVKSLIGEYLLYHPGVAFKVYGENIPLSVLINVFGITGIEILLAQEALQFVLWTPLITYSNSEIQGVLPIQHGNLNSKAHSDPEESVAAGLNWLTSPIPDTKKKAFIRKVVNAYKLPPNEFAVKGATFGCTGYDQNQFACLGLPKKKDITELNLTERQKLCRLATESLELATLTHFKYNTVDEYELAVLNESKVDQLLSARQIKAKTDVIFKIASLPSLSDLINSRSIKLANIPAMRETNNSVKFRNWIINTKANEDAHSITSEYIAAITKEGYLDRGLGKFIKSVSVSMVLGGVGGLIAGLHGAAVGAVLGKAAEPAIDAGLGLLDTYCLEGLTKGWTPRHYLSREIAPLVAKARMASFPDRNDPCYCGSGKKYKKCCMP